MMNLSLIVLTYNEELNLEACLASAAPIVSEIILIDSGSTDATVEIAKRFGATIFYHPFETHAKQWKWALENVPTGSPWILGLDSDQRISEGLAQELLDLFTNQVERVNQYDGFFVKRRQIFRGKWIKYGGYYPKYLLKIFKRAKVWLDPEELVDHHFYVFGPTALLQHDILEDNKKESAIFFWIEKHNKYAKLLALEEERRLRQKVATPIQPAFFGNPDQRIYRLKKLWLRMPLLIRPFFYFFYRYFLRLGFLDGKEGFIFHFLHGFWFRLLVDINRHELGLRNIAEATLLLPDQKETSPSTPDLIP